MTLRSSLYKLARVFGDLNAIHRGRRAGLMKRMARRALARPIPPQRVAPDGAGTFFEPKRRAQVSRPAIFSASLNTLMASVLPM
jgi:hypothetical protein